MYVPPIHGEASPALDAATGVFDGLNIDRAAIEDAEEVAQRARNLLDQAK